MLPVYVFVGVAIPLLVIGYIAMRKKNQAGEHPASMETDAERARTEREFADAERYEAEWREEQHKRPGDNSPGV